MNNSNGLRILQYNVMKSKDKVMASLLRDERIKEFDVIAIQEPWRNSFSNTTHHAQRQHFNLIYLDDPNTRTCVFINTRIPRNRWTAIFHSPDFCTVSIQCGETAEDVIHIHNIYNPVADMGESVIPLLHRTILNYASDKQIAVGDFNLHHPLWGGESSTRCDREAEDLLQLMADHQLELILPPGTITYDSQLGQVVIDLALGTPWVHERVTFCGVRDDLDHQLDHLPVATDIMTAVEACDPPDRWEWQRTDAKALEHHLQSPTTAEPPPFGRSHRPTSAEIGRGYRRSNPCLHAKGKAERSVGTGMDTRVQRGANGSKTTAQEISENPYTKRLGSLPTGAHP
jgi:exonuclease III